MQEWKEGIKVVAKLRVAGGSNEQTEESAPVEVPRRLVVELNRRTAADLAWLVEEEEMNKTTLVNRAVQLYRIIVDAQRRGVSVNFEDAAQGKTERLVIV